MKVVQSIAQIWKLKNIVCKERCVQKRLFGQISLKCDLKNAFFWKNALDQGKYIVASRGVLQLGGLVPVL